MNILNKLKSIFYYYEVTRQHGHTTAMLNGALNSDCIVLAPSHGMGRHLKNRGIKNIISLNNVDNSLRGQYKPLLIDNSTMCVLLNDSIKEIEEMGKTIKRLNTELEYEKNRIKHIKEMIYEI